MNLAVDFEGNLTGKSRLHVQFLTRFFIEDEKVYHTCKRDQAWQICVKTRQISARLYVRVEI